MADIDQVSVKFNYIFIPAGSTVSRIGDVLTVQGDTRGPAQTFPYGSTFVLDVGNSPGEGVVDHHQPGTEDQCVASLIANNPDKWIGKYLKESKRYWLVTHSEPDFDALGAVYLVEKYIKERSLPGFVKEFAESILKVDSGKKKLDSEHIIEPFSLVLAISETIRNDPSITLEDKDNEILNVTFSLFDSVWDVLSEGQGIGDFDWESLSGFQDQISLIKRDVFVYRQDLIKRSQIHRIGLQHGNSLDRSPVDCLITRFPQSILWKYWARGDAECSPSHKGFTVTVAFLPSKNTRAIISVDPTTGYRLKGLGLYLDYLEIKRFLADNANKDVIGIKRAGFHRENPWYDGRSSMHNYTIIDAPRGGSQLSVDDIGAVLNTDVWRLAFSYQNLGNLNTREIMHHFDKHLGNAEIQNEK